jgi:hypothetical protein
MIGRIRQQDRDDIAGLNTSRLKIGSGVGHGGVERGICDNPLAILYGRMIGPRARGCEECRRCSCSGQRTQYQIQMIRIRILFRNQLITTGVVKTARSLLKRVE